MVEITGSKLWEPQDLIDDLQQVIDEEPDVYPNDRVVTLCMARDYLKEFFQNREWISVKDRLPELELAEAKANDIDILRCLAFIKNRRAQNGAYVGLAWFDGEYFIDSDCIILDVTHWMPLPEPPKED